MFPNNIFGRGLGPDRFVVKLHKPGIVRFGQSADPIQLGLDRAVDLVDHPDMDGIGAGEIIRLVAVNVISLNMAGKWIGLTHAAPPVLGEYCRHMSGLWELYWNNYID